jgi:hypothetical protein
MDARRQLLDEYEQGYFGESKYCKNECDCCPNKGNVVSVDYVRGYTGERPGPPYVKDEVVEYIQKLLLLHLRIQRQVPYTFSTRLNVSQKDKVWLMLYILDEVSTMNEWAKTHPKFLNTVRQRFAYFSDYLDSNPHHRKYACPVVLERVRKKLEIE